METCLNIQPFIQPSPAKNPGGECFACAMTAALRHIFPERPIDFEQAYGLFVDEKSGHLSNTWPGFRAALYRARTVGYQLEIASDLVEPHFDAEMRSHAWWSYFPVGRYAHRLEGYLRGGWVAFTEINYAGTGPMTDGLLNGTDHFVVLDGVRQVWEPGTLAGSSALNQYIRVVCSVKGVYWMPLRDFLYRHGGSGWWLCRREER